jgi:hypothetical protein
MQWIASSARAQSFGVIAKEFSNVTYCGYLAYFPGEARTATGIIFDFIVNECIIVLTRNCLHCTCSWSQSKPLYRFNTCSRYAKARGSWDCPSQKNASLRITGLEFVSAT